MAGDKSISALESASIIKETDLFVLQQDGHAMKMSGETMRNQLAELLEGHGGISSITGPVTDKLVDTYTIHFADGNTTTFKVTNGETGPQGIQGIPGPQGDTQAIKNITWKYAVSEDYKTQPASNAFSTVFPDITTKENRGKFLWSQMSVQHYTTSGSTSTRTSCYPVYIGKDGDVSGAVSKIGNLTGEVSISDLKNELGGVVSKIGSRSGDVSIDSLKTDLGFSDVLTTSNKSGSITQIPTEDGAKGKIATVGNIGEYIKLYMDANYAEEEWIFTKEDGTQETRMVLVKK